MKSVGLFGPVMLFSVMRMVVCLTAAISLAMLPVVSTTKHREAPVYHKTICIVQLGGSRYVPPVVLCIVCCMGDVSKCIKACPNVLWSERESPHTHTNYKLQIMRHGHVYLLSQMH